MSLSAEELLAGASLTYEVEVPAEILDPGGGNGRTPEGASAPARTVRLRPLNVQDLQLVSRAAKESDTLLGALMVQRALVEPELTVAEVARLSAGLVEYLLARVNALSGLDATARDIAAATEAPLVRAAHVLARDYGWTSRELEGMTLGQILLHVRMSLEEGGP